ncbi:MAG: 50S ribosomal protein L3 N(5)-glutamine methyltransferase [Thiotrichales bacterium]
MNKIDYEAAASELRTLRDFIRWGASRFAEAGLYFGHGTDNALDEASWLVLHALSLPLDLADAYRDCALTQGERTEVLALLQERIESKKPAAYLTGEAFFCGLSFMVNESVLVPRSPIAELLEASFQPWVNPEEVSQVLDLCTGSGCIGVAAAYAFPSAHIDATDISPEALSVAAQNVEQHSLADRVDLYQADLFTGLPKKRYDLIIANPPYVDAEDMSALPDEYHQEPVLGLAAGEDGLELVRRILAEAGEYLADNGALIVEVGNSQPALTAAFPETPFTWLEFERGGHGVFYLPASAVLQLGTRHYE